MLQPVADYSFRPADESEVGNREHRGQAARENCCHDQRQLTLEREPAAESASQHGVKLQHHADHASGEFRG
jgi:hypothetical protein